MHCHFKCPLFIKQRNLFVDTMSNILALNEIDDLSTHDLLNICLYGNPNLMYFTNFSSGECDEFFA